MSKTTITYGLEAPHAPKMVRVPNEDVPHPQYMPHTKKPQSLMLLGVVAASGEVCPPIWFPDGFRLSTAYYIAILLQKVIPRMRQIASNHARLFCRRVHLPILSGQQ